MKRRPAHEIAADILSCFDEETGEIDGDALDALQDEMTGKIEAMGYLVSERLGMAAVAKAEASRQTERAKRFAADADRITARAQMLLDVLGQQKVVTPTVTASVHKGSLRTVIDDELEVPAEYASTVETIKIDKKAIGAAIDGGEDIPGAHRERGDSKLHWK